MGDESGETEVQKEWGEKRKDGKAKRQRKNHVEKEEKNKETKENKNAEETNGKEKYEELEMNWIRRKGERKQKKTRSRQQITTSEIGNGSDRRSKATVCTSRSAPL